MATPTTRRLRADEVLLSAPAPGWVPREDVIGLMAGLVMPGQAHRAADRNRAYLAAYRGGEFRPHEDHVTAVAVGARRLAMTTLQTAIQCGTWLTGEIGGVPMLRHRDWVAPGFTVPTLDELQGMARLLTATDWERAAIVAAFVEVGEHGGDRTSKRTSALAPKEFAALGIAGLRSDNTVRRYADAWRSTGLPRPTPGEPVTLPTDPFPAAPQAGSVTRRGFPIASNDPSELASSWLAHGKSIELLQEVLASARRQAAPSPRRRRTRAGNVIELTERKTS